jgi:hypothetical protein
MMGVPNKQICTITHEIPRMEMLGVGGAGGEVPNNDLHCSLANQ